MYNKTLSHGMEAVIQLHVHLLHNEMLNHELTLFSLAPVSLM